jgi:myo-inositol-1(or 4)-monophosphatase
MDTTLTFMIDLAHQAGMLLLDYYKKGHFSLRHKSDKSLVTDADTASDNLINNTIHHSFPNDLIISEELSPLSPNQPLNSVWIIDPLDGTTNFALGLKYWGVLITYLQGGYPIFTSCYYPALDELYTSSTGHGAYLNEKSIAVEDVDNDQKLSFFSCCSRTYKNYEVSIPYKVRILGCASYSMCCAARGLSRVSFEAKAKIWDIAGAWLLMKESGGMLDVLDGELPFPLHQNKDYSFLSFPTLAAPNIEVINQAKRKIIRKSK